PLGAAAGPAAELGTAEAFVVDPDVAEASVEVQDAAGASAEGLGAAVEDQDVAVGVPPVVEDEQPGAVAAVEVWPVVWPERVVAVEVVEKLQEMTLRGQPLVYRQVGGITN
ncbi:hypothetical protein GGI24_003088, partial [Coemansia furcata]